MNKKIKRPSLFLHLTEIFRALFETIKGLIFESNFAYKNIGNGQPILVIPGLLTTDLSTTLLRKFLAKLGFKVFGWEMGRNLGRMESLPVLIEKVERFHQQYQQKIIIIGWSMGGIFTREIAKKRPDLVQRTITIGSPFADVNAPNWAKWIFDLLNKGIEIDNDFIAQLPNPAPVPALALYSKLDGIVPWRACMELTESDLHKNKEIKSSHFGMGTNPEVLKTIYSELQSPAFKIIHG